MKRHTTHRISCGYRGIPAVPVIVALSSYDIAQCRLSR